MNIEIIAKQVVDAAYQVHKYLGPGLLESTYQHCFIDELRNKGLYVEKEKKLPIIYKGKILKDSLRLDVLVENQIIVELKSVDALAPIHKAQLITYLRLSERQIGFLINFNVVRFKDGINRLVYKYEGG